VKVSIMVNGPVVSPAQVRAARAWLNWTQDELSARSGISQRTIAKYELGRSVPHADTLSRIRHAFESAGIGFQFDGVIATGIGVR
jgi:transcriptional regulator with XRE-family HTH domain